MEAEVARLWTRLTDHENRIRSISDGGTPTQMRLVADVDNLQHKVERMDIEGTHVTQLRLSNIEDDIREIKESLKRQEDSKGADRRVVLGALLAAATAIALAILQLVVK